MNSSIGKAYSVFLSELKNTSDVNLNTNFNIYLSLFEMRTALWKYCLDNKRMIDFSFSDLFQDLVAQYIQKLLPDKSLILEEKKGRYRPDIVIYDNVSKDKVLAIIEIKTTVGWNRDLINKKGFLERIKNLARCYEVNQKQVFFIFESSGNVDTQFSRKIWETNNRPFTGRIFPLFRESAHPNTMKDGKYKSWENYHEYTMEEIKEKYDRDKVCGFELENILEQKGLLAQPIL